MVHVLIYDKEYRNIETQDLPEKGHLAVCTIGPGSVPPGRITWEAVRSRGDGKSPKRLGLFWDKEHAVLFAEAVAKKEGEQ